MMRNEWEIQQFAAGNFLELARSALGKALWVFLNEHDNLIRMETASDLERVAVEPLSERLLATFGDEIRQDRVKQMIGRMARQVMEERGYRIDRQNVRISSELNMFASGTRYIKNTMFPALDWGKRVIEVLTYFDKGGRVYPAQSMLKVIDDVVSGFGRAAIAERNGFKLDLVQTAIGHVTMALQRDGSVHRLADGGWYETKGDDYVVTPGFAFAWRHARALNKASE